MLGIQDSEGTVMSLRFYEDAAYFDFNRRIYHAFYRATKSAEEMANRIDRVSLPENFVRYVRSYLGAETYHEHLGVDDTDEEDSLGIFELSNLDVTEATSATMESGDLIEAVAQ